MLNYEQSLNKRNNIDILDEGFKIVQPSITVEERFGLKGNDEIPDFEVHDRQDRQGVQASGTFEAVKALTIILQDCLDDVIIRAIQPPLPHAGSFCVDVEFPHLSKRKLDKIRGSVITTEDGHHHYKACGGEVSSAVDMAEKLLEENGPRKEVKGLLEQAVRMEYPTVGSMTEIEHVKLHGEVFYLGKAIVEVLNYSNSMIQFRRVFKTKRIYDDLKSREGSR